SLLDPLQAIAAQHRHAESAGAGLAQNRLSVAFVPGYHQELDPAHLGQPVEIRPHRWFVAQVRIDGHEDPPAALEIPYEALPHAPTVLVVQIKHRSALEMEGVI